jgi:hypothetical protein
MLATPEIAFEQGFVAGVVVMGLVGLVGWRYLWATGTRTKAKTTK